ncbi:MAG: endonuclease/exonuclease/phosphatase family protein [Acidimicrobiales bacterium]
MADRPARLVIRWDRLAIVFWIATGLMCGLALTQLAGFTWIPLVWMLQAFTPYLLLPALPAAVVAAWRRQWTAATVHGGLLLVLLWLMAPVVWHDDPPAIVEGSPRLTIAAGNVFYQTTRADDVVASLMATDADVLAVTEFSVDVQAAFERAGSTERYPFQAGEAPGDRNGVAIYSRFPIVDRQVTRLGDGLTVDATIDVDGTPLRVVVVHPLPGTDGASLSSWFGDLRALRDVFDPTADDGPPTMVVGDFNATRWHPAFRELLDRGWHDAHEMLGRGFSRSWPTDLGVPPLVRIDHALLDDRVSPVQVHDVDLPGSDHRGLVLEVAVPPAVSGG